MVVYLILHLACLGLGWCNEAQSCAGGAEELTTHVPEKIHRLTFRGEQSYGPASIPPSAVLKRQQRGGILEKQAWLCLFWRSKTGVPRCRTGGNLPKHRDLNWNNCCMTSQPSKPIQKHKHVGEKAILKHRASCKYTFALVRHLRAIFGLHILWAKVCTRFWNQWDYMGFKSVQNLSICTWAYWANFAIHTKQNVGNCC